MELRKIIPEFEMLEVSNVVEMAAISCCLVLQAGALHLLTLPRVISPVN
jgi:hypothetical protein